jgi:transposase, IS30 family
MCNYQQLSQEERYTITALLRSHSSKAEIARFLKRSPSTIYRELSRNRSTHDNDYRAEVAHSYATARRRRSRRGSHFTLEQMQMVIVLLKEKWSPEQISNVLALEKKLFISHETIYQFILKDKKMDGSLFRHLRIMPKLRRKRYNSHDSRGILPGKRYIANRPKYIDSRKTFGHWECDTVIGSDRHHCILTLVERKSGLVIIRKLQSRTESAVTRAAIAVLNKHHSRIKSITFDNGSEFHGYKKLEERFPVTCYFANPYHSWERGTNENTNGLVRQYIPKGTCMRKLTQVKCDWIASKLNCRPRKRHGYKSPQEVFYGK